MPEPVQPPSLVVIARPNGSGTSTSAPRLLRDTLAVSEFVNADVIAQGLSGFDPSQAALAAGRLMLGRVKELARSRRCFAFETTLATRSFAPWIAELLTAGYQFHLIFLWLPDDELACARVRSRVASGGHDIPVETIRRRFTRGIQNLRKLYIPLATTWKVYDNSQSLGPRCIARGGTNLETLVIDETSWEAIQAHD